MNLRLCLLLFVLGVILVCAQGAPTSDVAVRVKARGDTRQTVDDALSIPIAALEAVQNMLNNLFSSRTVVEVRKH